jgi:hypothetical protein
LVISAASIERFLKWGAVPLALVVAFFVSRYSDDIFGTSDTGLDATARARFVDSTAQACLVAQNSDPASKAFSPVVIDQYCHCYADGMADRLSDDGDHGEVSQGPQDATDGRSRLGVLV